MESKQKVKSAKKDTMFKVAAVQMASSPHVSSNLVEAKRLIELAAKQGAKIVALPEYFCIMGTKDFDKVTVREKPNDGPIQTFLAKTAMCCVVNDSYRNARAFPVGANEVAHRNQQIGSPLSQPMVQFRSQAEESTLAHVSVDVPHRRVAEFPQMPGNDVLRKPVRMDDAYPQLLEKLVQGCRGLIGLGHDSRQLHERTR